MISSGGPVRQSAAFQRVYLLPVLVLGLGLGLRLGGLTRQGFWTDELYVVGEARQPLAVLFDPALHFQHPPGYRLMLHAWLGLSLDAAWIRLLPAVAGMLLIPVVWVLARTLWPGVPGAGPLAGLLVATSPFLLHYSQDVTTYSWTMLWVSGSMLLLVLAWRTDRAAWWAAWVVSCAGALYSHYFSLFPLLAEGAGVVGLGLWAGRRARRRLGHAVLAGAGAVALYAPWLAVLLGHQGEVLGNFLFPLTVEAQPLRWLPLMLAGTARPTFWLSGLAVLGTWTALGVLGIGGGWWLRRTWTPGTARATALILGWGLAATAGPYAFLRLTTPPGSTTPVRFAALAVPALLLGLGVILAALPRVARAGALVVWLALAGVQWGAEVTGPPPQDWRGLLGTVAAQAQPGDAFLAFPAFHTGAAAAYYPIPLPVQGGWFVGEGADPTGAAYWFPPGWTWRGFLNVRATRSTDWAGEIGLRVAGAGRVWYLAGDASDLDGTYKPSPAAERALAAAGYQPTQEWHAPPLILRLYTYTRGGP